MIKLQLVGRPITGLSSLQFGTISKRGASSGYYSNSWFFCRERFHSRLNFDKVEYFLVYYKYKDITILEKFISEIEDKLKLKAKDRLVFVPFEENTILFKVSNWWKKNNLRIQILSIIVRAALVYAGKSYSFEGIVNSEKYLHQTQKAFRKFLSGKTRYLGKVDKVDGWYSHFRKNKNLWKMW